MFSERYDTMATLSLCMIVKNEEAVISRCLESVKAAADEIIIVDTGSTDKTKEIAHSYTPLVFDFKWVDDFSAARNYSFSKASMNYIMWLDADDVITEDNALKLTTLKNQLKDESAVMMKYNTAFDEDGKPIFSYYRERLINRRNFIEWKGRVHETALYSGNAVYSDIEINHMSVKKEYSTRNLDIYEKQIAADEKMTPRDYFYYGRELYYHKKFSKAIKVLGEFIDSDGGWFENKIEACKILSYCHSQTGDFKKAFDDLTRSFIYDDPRAEICCLIGNLFMKQSLYSRAIFWFKLALDLPQNNESGGFIDLDCHGFLPCIQLCVCYDKLNDHIKAQEYNLKAGAIRPHSEAYLYNLKYFEQLHKKGMI